jgi:hypothetical protein
MVEAHERGLSKRFPFNKSKFKCSSDIKLIIALHDRYQLGWWGNDTHVEKYNRPSLALMPRQATMILPRGTLVRRQSRASKSESSIL